MKVREILEYNQIDEGVWDSITDAATKVHDKIWPELSSDPAVQSAYRARQQASRASRHATAVRLKSVGKLAKFLGSVMYLDELATPTVDYLSNMDKAQEYVASGKWNESQYDAFQKEEGKRLTAKYATYWASKKLTALPAKAVKWVIVLILRRFLPAPVVTRLMSYVDDTGRILILNWINSPDGAKAMAELMHPSSDSFALKAGAATIDTVGGGVAWVAKWFEDKANQYLNSIGIDIEAVGSAASTVTTPIKKGIGAVAPTPGVMAPTSTPSNSGAVPSTKSTGASTPQSTPAGGKVSTASIPRASTSLSKYAVDGAATGEKPKDGKAEPKADSANKASDVPKWASKPEDMTKWEYYKPGWIRNKETGEVKYGTK